MTGTRIYDFIFKGCLMLWDAIQGFVDLLSTSFKIPLLGEFTVLEMIIGVGLPSVLTYGIIKFLLPTS